MARQINPAVRVLSLVLEDAARRSGTPPEDILVRQLEFRSRTEDPGPLPHVFFITLGNDLEYTADTQGNFVLLNDDPMDLTDRELRVRFTQTGGLGGSTTTYEADDAALTDEDAEQLRQHLVATNFFELPDEVSNGDPLPDQFTYTLWIAHGRRNRELTTYDGTGPHQSPPLEKLIEWLKQRVPQPGTTVTT